MGCAASTNQGSERIIGTYKLKETIIGPPDLQVKVDMPGFGASDCSKQTTGLALADYTILPSILRKDQYGDIRKVIHRPSGTTRALKIVNQKVHGTEGIKRALLEAQIMSKMNHPNVAKLYEYFQKGTSLYLVAEICSGENLLVHILKHMSFMEKDASSLMRQLLSAVSYLHEKGLVHRDLRPEILVLDSPKIDANLKIVDFSSGRWLVEEERLTSKKGTVHNKLLGAIYGT